MWEDETLLAWAFVHAHPKPYKCPAMSRYGGEIPTTPRLLMKKFQEAIGAAEWGKRLNASFPLDAPISARYVFYLPRPASKKRKDYWADTAADVDNLVKSVSDAAQKCGILKNDSRIVELLAAKVWTPLTGDNAIPVGVRCEYRVAPGVLNGLGPRSECWWREGEDDAG